MLTIAYMPSDFHPLVLVHVDRAGLSEVARALGCAAAGQSAQTLTGSGASRLVIQVDEAELGLRVENKTLHWQLNPALAAHYVAELDAFYRRDEPSGSVFLEQGRLNEIPVKVTLGEFDDAFFD